ncbi:hypothetical protein D3C87_1223530 [compost metagenome]
MQHGTAVSQCPAFPAFGLLANKAIGYRQQIVGKRLFIIDMTILPVKIAIIIITHFHQAIFNTKGICIIFIVFVLGNFNVPVFQIFPIKKVNPTFLGI